MTLQMPAWRRPSGGYAVRLAVLAIAVLLLWRLSGIVLLVFMAALVADVLGGAADALAARLHAPRQAMLALVAIVLLGGGCAVLYWIGPAITRQASDLVVRLAGQLSIWRGHYGHNPIIDALTSRLANAAGLESDVTGFAFSAASFTLGALADLFAVVVLSLYLAAAPAVYIGGAVALVPPAHRPLARAVIEEVGRNLRRWLAGQIADMIIVGGLSAAGLVILGVPVPFALATLAGLLTIVPYFGSLASGVPAVMVGLTQGWRTAVWVVVLYVVCHVIEGYVVAPLMQSHLVRLPPAVCIGAMAIAGSLFGMMGILLGTPLAVAGLVIVRRVYVEHVLGDRVPLPAEG